MKQILGVWGQINNGNPEQTCSLFMLLLEIGNPAEDHHKSSMNDLKLELHFGTVSQTREVSSHSLVHRWWSASQNLETPRFWIRKKEGLEFERVRERGISYLNIRCWRRAVRLNNFFWYESNTTFPLFRGLKMVFNIHYYKWIENISKASFWNDIHHVQNEKIQNATLLYILQNSEHQFVRQKCDE